MFNEGGHAPVISGSAAMFTLETASFIARSASSSSYLQENTIRVKGVTESLKCRKVYEQNLWMVGKRTVDWEG